MSRTPGVCGCVCLCGSLCGSECVYVCVYVRVRVYVCVCDDSGGWEGWWGHCKVTKYSISTQGAVSSITGVCQTGSHVSICMYASRSNGVVARRCVRAGGEEDQWLCAGMCRITYAAKTRSGPGVVLESARVHNRPEGYLVTVLPASLFFLLSWFISFY